MKKTFWGALVLVCVPITAAFAVKITNLYDAEVPVISKSSEAKEQAVKDGLRQVLVKLSGNSQIDKISAIRNGLNRAAYYVRDYHYSAETTDSSQYLLQLQYEPVDIKRLLASADVTYWGENRPLILVWLVVSGRNHNQEIMDNGLSASMSSDFYRVAKQRGIPLIFPMMDMDELNQVSTADITSVELPVLKEASKRYAPDALLIGDMQEEGQGMQSEWHLVMNTTQWDWAIKEKNTNAVITSLLDRVNQALIDYYHQIAKQ